jgi:hypothetical protein
MAFEKDDMSSNPGAKQREEWFSRCVNCFYDGDRMEYGQKISGNKTAGTLLSSLPVILDGEEVARAGWCMLCKTYYGLSRTDKGRELQLNPRQLSEMVKHGGATVTEYTQGDYDSARRNLFAETPNAPNWQESCEVA